MNIQHTFAENMKALRKKQGLTQEDLSEKSDLHRTYIGGIEQGRINVSLKNIGKIANALDTNPAFFFTRLTNSENDKVHGENHAKDDGFPCLEDTSDDDILYSLCIQRGTELSIKPIKIENLDLDVQILCSLIQNGYTDDELVQRYEETKQELFEYFHYSNNARTNQEDSNER